MHTKYGFAFFSEIQHVRDSKYGFVLQEGVPSAYWKVCMQSLHNLYMFWLILSQVIFLFLLVLGMIMYASEVETTTTTTKNNKKEKIT